MRHETTASIVLSTWERAYGLGLVERGLALLSLALPGESLASLSQMTIGQRDSQLLGLRTALFGNDIQCLDACPKCDEKIEVSFGVTDIRVVPLMTSEKSRLAEGTEDPSKVQQIEVDGRFVTVRPVTTADLMAIEDNSKPDSRRESLLACCVSESEIGSQSQSVGEVVARRFSEPGLKRINEKLAEIDPQADVRIALDCTRCEHHWSSRFDIVEFLWTEIDSWAQRLLADVHSLAMAYGWAERDILDMSPWRRHLYLGMLRR